jgi:hypothetical protein
MKPDLKQGKLAVAEILVPDQVGKRYTEQAIRLEVDLGFRQQYRN